MRALLVLCLALASGCAPFDPADIPEEAPWVITVKSCKLPEELPSPVDLAHHSWFDVKRGSETDWWRIEVLTDKAFTDENVVRVTPVSARAARKDRRMGQDVHLLKVVAGPEVEGMIEQLFQHAADYEDHANYRGWAGPNSNTFVDRLGRWTDGLRFELHHNAVGKDYAPIVRAGLTTSGTGIHFDTWLLGFKLGIEEGIELHFLNLTFGIDLFPPAIKLPFLPRLGFPQTSLWDR